MGNDLITADMLEDLAELMPAGVAYLLLYVRAKAREHGQDWLEMTQAVLGMRVGLTRDSVKRGLRILQKLGFITLKFEGHRSMIHVHNIVQLSNTVNEPPVSRPESAQTPPIIPEPPVEPAPKRKVFAKPSPQEVASYAESIGYRLSGEQFCDFYESKGWVVGKAPMKSWKAAVRTWVLHQGDVPKIAYKPPPKKHAPPPSDDDIVSPEDIHNLVVKLAGGKAMGR